MEKRQKGSKAQRHRVANAEVFLKLTAEYRVPAASHHPHSHSFLSTDRNILCVFIKLLTYKYSNHLLDKREIFHLFIFDDNRGTVFTEGYINPDSKPELVRKRKLSGTEPA